MLQGLLLYELILLITGGILFLVLVFALVWYVIKNKRIISLFPFFILPVIMIGWPTIVSISFDKGKIKINKLAMDVDKNPSDTTARKKLEESIAGVNRARVEKDPEALTSLSRAYYSLGKYDSAMLFTNKALIIKPNSPEAKKLNKTIQEEIRIKTNFQNNIRQLDNNLQNIDPGNSTQNTETINKVADILKTAEVPTYTDEKSNLSIAKGLATVNDVDKSLEIVNKVLKVNPASREAIQLKKDIENRKYNVTVTDTAKLKSIDSRKFNDAVIIKHSQ